MALHDQKYLSFTTFKKDGTPKPTAIWIADLGDGTMGFTTPEESWKVKRLKNNPNVVLQPCNMRGEIKEGTKSVEATAVAIAGGPELARVRLAIDSKYGLATTVIKAFNKLLTLIGKGATSDTAIIITVA
jgi:PPOX class probable F420-dependent enzyme